MANEKGPAGWSLGLENGDEGRVAMKTLPLNSLFYTLILIKLIKQETKVVDMKQYYGL